MITLRPTTDADLEWLIPLYESMMRPYYDAMNLIWDTDKFAQAYDPAASSIILLNSEEVGYLKVECREDYLYLGDIQLKPEFQNRGIGTKLIKDIQAQAKSEQLPLRLRVLKNNPAINLYNKLGFMILEENEISYILEYNQKHTARHFLTD